jgi:hypothetical protein
MGLALALTSGRGGGGDGGRGASSSDEPTSVQDAALQFAECMRENGIEDFPDPEVGDGGISVGGPDPEGLPPQERAEYQAARDACQPIIDDAVQGGEQLSPEEVAERQDDALAMAQCMRDRGWDMPDPEVTDDGAIRIRTEDDDGGVPQPEDPNFDQYSQDQQACSEEAGLPTPGEGAGGPGGSDDAAGGGDS